MLQDFSANPVHITVFNKKLPYNIAGVPIVTTRTNNKLDGAFDVYIEGLTGLQSVTPWLYRVLAPTGSISQWSRVGENFGVYPQVITAGWTGVQDTHVRINFNFDANGLTGTASSHGQYFGLSMQLNTPVGITGSYYSPDLVLKLYDPIDWTGVTGPIDSSFFGITGPIGATGAQGVPGGSTGYGGITGLQGPTGYQAVTGAQGIQGITGLQGPTGYQGDTGASPTGEQGITGYQGPTGYQGITGPIGLGMTGPQGVTGLVGETGVQGTTGTQGVPGTTGIANFLDQADPKPSSWVIPTLLWSETQDALFAGVTGSTKWVQISAGSMAGPTGVQGATGFGLIGYDGATGVQGTTGTQGVQGDTGSQGVTGTGATGLQGPTGIQGAVGQTGAQGFTGPGATGLQGLTGLQGAQGNTGVQGVQGNTGSKGTTGIQGTTGLQGAQGNTGVQGTQGNTGAQGGTGVANFVQGSFATSYLNPMLLWSPADEALYAGITGPGGKWVQISAGSLKGDTGIQGTTGALGNTGARGITGLIGPTGVQGITGRQGAGYDTRVYQFSILAPAVGGVPGPKLKSAETATRISSFSYPYGACSFNIETRTNPGSTGSNLLSSAQLATTAGTDATTFAVSNLTADSWLWLDIASLTGPPSSVSITVSTQVS